jgi:hypothetical protein
MKILFLSYWGIDDGLTRSVIFPHLEYLIEKQIVKEIHFCTIERETGKVFSNPFQKKIIHHPLFSKNIKLNLVNKLNDFVLFPKLIRNILLDFKIDHAITHSSLGGSLLSMTCLKLQIKYSIFFEPHSEYMIESGVWKNYDPRFLFQKYWEKHQLINATNIFTVSSNNKIVLEQKYPNRKDKILVAPNSVDFNQFSISTKPAIINISNELIVGIYVGKFGDIYYDLESFDMFKKTYNYFNKQFFLILLSPDDKIEITRKLNNVNFPISNVFIDKVPHNDVPQYLTLADFAFSNIKPAPCRKFCCPIKNGEYWSMGLPILTPDNIGDDTDIIRNEGCGVIYNLDDFDFALNLLQNDFLNKDSSIVKEKMRQVALKYRSFEHTQKCLDKILHS